MCKLSCVCVVCFSAGRVGISICHYDTVTILRYPRATTCMRHIVGVVFLYLRQRKNHPVDNLPGGFVWVFYASAFCSAERMSPFMSTGAFSS